MLSTSCLTTHSRLFLILSVAFRLNFHGSLFITKSTDWRITNKQSQKSFCIEFQPWAVTVTFVIQTKTKYSAFSRLNNFFSIISLKKFIFYLNMTTKHQHRQSGMKKRVRVVFSCSRFNSDDTLTEGENFSFCHLSILCCWMSEIRISTCLVCFAWTRAKIMQKSQLVMKRKGEKKNGKLFFHWIISTKTWWCVSRGKLHKIFIRLCVFASFTRIAFDVKSDCEVEGMMWMSKSLEIQRKLDEILE